MINRQKLKDCGAREEQRFIAEHPRSAELYARAKDSLLGGVPMNWMKKWAGAFPIFVAQAKGAHFTDVDGREYVDLCLGDTGAMLAKRFNDGVAGEIKKHGLPWNVIQLGARTVYHFSEKPPRNGGESAAAADFELERFLHLYALNRGVLLTPFHNMALMCRATTEADVGLHTKIFADATSELLA